MSKQLPCPYCKDSWLFASKYDSALKVELNKEGFDI